MSQICLYEAKNRIRDALFIIAFHRKVMRQLSEIRMELSDLRKMVQGKTSGRERVVDIELVQCDEVDDLTRLEEKVKSDNEYATKLVGFSLLCIYKG